jgi:hypothetical protein
MALIPTALAFGLLTVGALPAPGGLLQPASRLATLPDNPCGLFTPRQLSTITRLNVTTAERTRSLTKVVEAQRQNRDSGPGTICVYDTRSAFAAIDVYIPPHATRATEKYWAVRTQYFQTYRGSAQPIPHVGVDAWLAGGAALHVLIRENEYFIVSTQMYQPQSRELLIRIAVAVLARF